MSKGHINLRKKKIYSFFRILLFYICTVIILMTTSRLTKNLSKTNADLLSVFSASIFTFFLVIAFTKWEKIQLKDVGIIPNASTLNRFFLGLAIGLSIAVIQVLIVLSFGHLKLLFIPTFSIRVLILPLMLYFFVALREELAFRSYMLRRLDQKFEIFFALSVMIILFIFEHIISGMSWKMAIIGSGLGGLLFGIAALKTKGIAVSIGLHTSWNFGQWLLGFKNQSGIFQAIVDKGYEAQTENIGLVSFIFVIMITIFIISFKKSNIS